MPPWLRRRRELEAVSPEIAWKLVDTLFGQSTSLYIGSIVFGLLAVIGWQGTGSALYLAGGAYALLTLIWRALLVRAYKRHRDTASAAAWARRFAIGAWVAAAGWGLWSLPILLEPNKILAMMMIGTLSATVIGGAVRNCAIRRIAIGQILLTLIPLCLVCLASPIIYLKLYSGFVVLHMIAALTLTDFLHKQTLRMLTQDEEKSELVARLETANQELEVVNQHLETLVATDSLTGVANRRAFDLALSREWRRSAREQEPLSLLLLDVDHFKAYNDQYGHQAGDECLRQVAAAITAAVRRPADLVARYGGEEFAVVLPETYLSSAGGIAEIIVAAVEAKRLAHECSPLGHITVSIGAACMIPVHTRSFTDLAALADDALYTAKRRGRNRVHTMEAARRVRLTA